MQQATHEISLQDAPSGNVFLVSSLSGGPGRLSKLYAMGILPGTELFVCHGTGGGVRVNVRGSSVILGNCLAGAIMGRVAAVSNASADYSCKPTWAAVPESSPGVAVS